MEKIATNYKNSFTKLLTKPYSNKYKILHSFEERNQESLYAFFDVIFGKGQTAKLGDLRATGADDKLIEVRLHHSNLKI